MTNIMRDSMLWMVPVLSLSLAYSGLVLANSSCSESERESNLAECLEGIKAGFEDKSLFWFGTEYNTRCANDRFSVDCFSMLQTENNSLADLTFNHKGGSFNRDLIDRYVEVTFTSEPGTLTGCDHEEEIKESKTFSLEPLSGTIYSPWDTRNSPAITWDADEGEQYTVMAYDIGYGILHALYVNVPGNDINKGKVLKQYSGPLNNRDVPNPYSFMIFKQNQTNITVSPDLTLFGWFNPADFQKSYDLHGPIAVTWMKIGFDAYSVGIMASRGIIQNCAGLVKLELRDEPAHIRPWFPSFAEYDLGVYMSIQFTTEAVEYKACCSTEEYSGGTILLDPLDQKTVLDAVEVRDGEDTTMEVTMFMNKLYPNNTIDFIGKNYTLLSVDPDVPNPGAGTQEKPIAHMLVVNIQGSDFTTGSTIIPYSGPKPPDYKPHYYYFLLYEQEHEMETNTSYYLEYTKEGSNRLLFDMDSFLSNETLKLVGVNWMRATTDSWVRKTHLDQGRDRDGVCEPITCETSSGHKNVMKFLPTCLYISITVVYGYFTL